MGQMSKWTTHKVVGLREAYDGVLYGTDGYVYLPHPTDPRPSMCIKVGPIANGGIQSSMNDYL